MTTCSSPKCSASARFEVLRLEAGQRWTPYCAECTTRIKRCAPGLHVRQLEVVADDRARRRRLGL